MEVSRVGQSRWVRALLGCGARTMRASAVRSRVGQSGWAHVPCQRCVRGVALPAVPVAVWVVYVHPGYGSGTGGANGVQPYDTLVCIACLSYPSENELALLKIVLGLTGYMTDSLHCSLGIRGVWSITSCLFSFLFELALCDN